MVNLFLSCTSLRRPKSLVAACIVLVAAACGEPPPPPAPAAPPVKSAEERARWYQNCWNQFNTQAWDVFQTCYAETAVSEAIDQNPPSVSGRAAIIARDKAEAAGLPDRRGEVRLILVNGDHLASIALYSGTNTGPLPPGPDGKPIPATKKSVGFLIAHAADLDPTGAHVVRDAAYIDENTFAAQLGLSKGGARHVEGPSGASPSIVIAKNDETERANQAAARAMFDALTAHDLAAAGKAMADGYKLIEIAQPKDMDKKAALASLKEAITAFPDVAIRPTTLWTAGDYVVAEGTFAGTNTGNIPSMGLRKTGKKVSVRFFEVMRFEKGQIQDDWLFYNGAAFTRQLTAK